MKQQNMAEEIVRVCDHFPLQQRNKQLAAPGHFTTLNTFQSPETHQSQGRMSSILLHSS
jgi:hypothetical protein